MLALQASVLSLTFSSSLEIILDSQEIAKRVQRCLRLPPPISPMTAPCSTTAQHQTREAGLDVARGPYSDSTSVTRCPGQLGLLWQNTAGEGPKSRHLLLTVWGLHIQD